MVIQRSWKILSDAGSTSASSTEANRSPSAINTSSDDSDCSNQTTHSMVTSVASPPGHIFRSEIIPSTSTAIASDTIKYITTPQMAETTLQKLRQRFSNTAPMTSSSSESGMRSLELVRIAVQSAFDKEVDDLMKHYIETYFKPAFSNIKENLGQGAVNEDALQKMSCALLENAKSQYKIQRFKPQPSLAAPSNMSVVASAAPESTHVRMPLKRSVATSKPIASASDTLPKRFFPDSMVLKGVSQQQSQNVATHHLSGGNAIKSAAAQSQSTTTGQQTQKPQATSTTTSAQSQPRRQIFWNTAHISTSTKFVLDVQANQAFGFTPEGKERLASKHPELIRYLPDNEDRDWLVAQQIIPQQNRNSRFLFLIYDEVRRLYQTHDVYKNKSSIDLSLMMTFSVPDFIIQKMKIFFVDLNIKSRGLITNSYSLTGNATSTTSGAQQSNSHLRNALLLGAATATPATSASLGAATSTSVSCGLQDDQSSSTGIVSCAVTASVSTATLPSTSSSNISSTEGLLHLKAKSTNLSSSHATLTALLNNNSSASSVSGSGSSAPTLLNKLRK